MVNKKITYSVVLFLVLGIILYMIYASSLNSFNNGSEVDNVDNIIDDNSNTNQDVNELLPPKSNLDGDGDLSEDYNDYNDYNSDLNEDPDFEPEMPEIPESEDPNYEPEICPAVCVSMWEIEGDQCVYDDCGSGCGPNNVTTFENEEDCLNNL